MKFCSRINTLIARRNEEGNHIPTTQGTQVFSEGRRAVCRREVHTRGVATNLHNSRSKRFQRFKFDLIKNCTNEKKKLIANHST